MSATITTPARRLPFSVRPRHRETVDSYDQRVRRANLLTTEHVNHLVRVHSPETTGRGRFEAWLILLAQLTGRAINRMVANSTGWLTHRDGTTCDQCAELLPQRWMCTLCARGEHVRQHPHFEGIVCIGHRRWVGLHDEPEQQRPVGESVVSSALQFEKLRRTSKIDVRLFSLLSAALSRTEDTRVTPATFSRIIAVIRLLNDLGFQQSFFDPQAPYATRFTFLWRALDGILHDGVLASKVARSIWLYARPTVYALHEEARTAKPTTHWAHDYTVSPIIIQTYRAATAPLEPLHWYLTVTTFRRGTPARYGLPSRGDRKTSRTPGNPGKSAMHVCRNGHEFRGPALNTAKTEGSGWPACPYCNGTEVSEGINDLQSQYPEVANEFVAKLNGGVTPDQVATTDRRKYIWLCPDDVRHIYPASPLNRTFNDSKCPMCLGRVIVAGINDLATTHPEVARDWHPTSTATTSPTQVTHGSKESVRFLCAKGHDRTMTIVERVAAGRCPDCVKEDNRHSRDNLTITHPEIAAQWHPTRNGESLASNYTHGSKQDAVWLCEQGDTPHTYSMRIERKVHGGYGCPICSNRLFLKKKNDIATLYPELAPEFHPYRNGVRTVAETKAGTQRYHWRCAHGHDTQQSITHRLLSKGCIECEPASRILAA